MKKIGLITGILTTVALIIATVLLIISIAAGEYGKKIIRLDEINTAVESTVKLTDLHPGDSVSGTYEIECVKNGELQITFRAGEEQSLLPFLTVTVVLNEEEWYTGALQDVIDTPISMQTDKKCDAIITYELPRDVGNEAQEAALDLKIDFRMK